MECLEGHSIYKLIGVTKELAMTLLGIGILYILGFATICLIIAGVVGALVQRADDHEKAERQDKEREEAEKAKKDEL
jgi:Na+-transporting methylmalonyl-CoA/oxaloacetate decarboxylase gamma subunit